MRYSARQLAIILGVQPSTITRDIRKGRLSASRNDKGGYLIDASEIVRACAAVLATAVSLSITPNPGIIRRFAGRRAKIR